MSDGQISLLEAFKVRHQTRTFNGALNQTKMNIVNAIVEEANQLQSPFGNNVGIQTHPPGLSKMWCVSNEAGWLIMKVSSQISPENKPKAIFDSCYKMQHAVMKLTMNNIQTGWVCGLFNPSLAEEKTPGFNVVGGVCYGEGASSKHFMAKVFSGFSNKGSRFEVDQLFWNKETNSPLSKSDDIIEAIRWGPSGMNHQSWRFVIDGESIHLFDSKKDDYSIYDMGIAAANIEMALNTRSPHQLQVLSPAPATCPLGGEYVISCIPK